MPISQAKAISPTLSGVNSTVTVSPSGNSCLIFKSEKVTKREQSVDSSLLKLIFTGRPTLALIILGE